MKNKKAVILAVIVSSLLVALAVIIWVSGGSSVATTAGEPGRSEPRMTGPMSWVGTGPMSLGRFVGQVTYDEGQGYYFLELQGARFPFKTSPLQVQEITLEAKGKNALEKNTSLLYGIVGPDVAHVTLLINPDEEDEVMPATTDIARYIQMVNASKFAGTTYTKPGGKLTQAATKSSTIQTLEDATAKTPIILLKGPKTGARKTRVSVLGDGKVIVEGKTYEDLYKAADLVSITLLKMLCGSPDCPDAAACTTGGDCGCG